MRNLLGLEDISADDIRRLLLSAAGFKEILSRPVRKVPTLRGRAMVTLFYEASTRTRTSFEMAAKILSAEAINVAVAQSSVTKGESLQDTVRTLQALQMDCLVIRHHCSGAAEYAAKKLDVPVINAGDGRHEHPTQGLLDLFSVCDHFDRLDTFDLRGLTLAIIGDIAHSRVARSDAWGFSKLGAKVQFAGPKTLMPGDCRSLPVTVCDDLKSGLEGAEVINVLRLQTERQERGLLPSLREYSRLWGVSGHSLQWAKPGALVMHPGPMNRGVEISADVADGCHSIIFDQVTHGVAVRMAVLYQLMGVEKE